MEEQGPRDSALSRPTEEVSGAGIQLRSSDSPCSFLFLLYTMLPFLAVMLQTLVHTDLASVFSGASAGTGSWSFDLEENPLKTGQIGTYFRKAVLFTTLIPTGKS